jgi:hypothetical protein
MNTNGSPSKYLAASNTVAHPVSVQPAPLAPIVTGTLGHAGVVEYSKSATAVVRETYVVTTKK